MVLVGRARVCGCICMLVSKLLLQICPANETNGNNCNFNVIIERMNRNKAYIWKAQLFYSET